MWTPPIVMSPISDRPPASTVGSLDLAWMRRVSVRVIRNVITNASSIHRIAARPGSVAMSAWRLTGAGDTRTVD